MLVPFTSEQLKNVRVNQRFLAIELLERGVGLSRFYGVNDILIASYKGKTEYIIGIQSAAIPAISATLADKKNLSKIILEQANIATCKGAAFNYESRFEALEFILSLNSPVAIKPVTGTNGQDVFLPISNTEDAEKIIEIITDEDNERQYLIEEFFVGEEYRIFVDRKGNIAVLHRKPAELAGDGKSSITQLAEAETFKRMNPRNTCLCPILLDDPARFYLALSNKDFNYVPKAGEIVQLRGNSNLMGGGTCQDSTDIIHSSVAEIAKKTLAAFPNLPYAGIDFMTKNISAEQSADTYRIIEVNVEPSVATHANPWRGTSRNVAAWVADIIFPESAK